MPAIDSWKPALPAMFEWLLERPMTANGLCVGAGLAGDFIKSLVRPFPGAN